jgi:hypothetical protein
MRAVLEIQPSSNLMISSTRQTCYRANEMPACWQQVQYLKFRFTQFIGSLTYVIFNCNHFPLCDVQAMSENLYLSSRDGWPRQTQRAMRFFFFGATLLDDQILDLVDFKSSVTPILSAIT